MKYERRRDIFIIICLLIIIALNFLNKRIIEIHSVHPVYGEYKGKEQRCDPWDYCDESIGQDRCKPWFNCKQMYKFFYDSWLNNNVQSLSECYPWDSCKDMYGKTYNLIGYMEKSIVKSEIHKDGMLKHCYPWDDCKD